MPLRPFQLFRSIAAESESSKRELHSIQTTNAERASRISRLAERKTQAFVELAQHYLPELSHQTLSDAWIEVRDEIRSLLLQKDDRIRSLQRDRQDAMERREELISQRDRVRDEMNQARIVLACKTGNFKKVLREDPAIIQCNDEIAMIDQEIECSLAHLTHAQEDAEKKLPAYEQCNLFQYLRDQDYGTPSYNARGMQRRWDRWVAKLTNYHSAKSSYDHLSETPQRLKQLIAEKQDRYQELLNRLELARENATEKFGVADQSKVWQDLGRRVGELDEAIEQTIWEESCVEDDLYELENVNGKYYEQALVVYRKFLSDLSPQILDVYAQCTPSPIDDQICARVRAIDQEITAEETATSNRAAKRKHLEKYIAGLAELRQRLRDLLRNTPADVEFADELCFDQQLRKMRERTKTPGDVWRQIRKSMVRSATRNRFDKHDPLGPLDATFKAAEALSPNGIVRPRADRTGTVLVQDRTFREDFRKERSSRGDEDGELGDELSFVTLAICNSIREAAAIRFELAKHRIKSFVCDWIPEISSTAEEEASESPDEIQVMVQVNSFERAHRILVQQRELDEASWSCPNCRLHVDRGYGVCHRCGKRRVRF